MSRAQAYRLVEMARTADQLAVVAADLAVTGDRRSLQGEYL
jgi:hypothetical protein